MKKAFTYLPALASGLVLAGCSCDKQAEQPNIIVILTDDMGYSDVGAYGGNFVPTPNIDRMADEGIRFMQYYSSSPISSPSRAGLLTGMCPGNWHITSYLQSRGGNRSAEMNDFLSTEAPTLPAMLQEAGYKTAHFGKWHLGGGRDVYNAPAITAYGYDEYVSTYESPDPDPLLTATDWIWSKQDSIKRWDRTAYFVDKTLDFLQRNDGQPCFINLWPDDMHTPWVGNFEEQQVFPDGEISEKNFKTVLTEYDRQIGRLLEGIRALNLQQETLVIFTSDNGPAPSFRGSRANGMRGCKASLFEGGIRMPFIVWSTDPNHPKGKVDETSVVCGFDLTESLCRIGKGTVPASYHGDGENISKTLLGKKEHKRKNPIFWEYRRNGSGAFPQPFDRDASPNLAVRKGEWKLIVNDDGSNPMLFNLVNDPNEQENKAEQEPAIRQQLQELVLGWRATLPQYTPQP